MWIRTKEKLVNTRHLAEISVKPHRMNNGTTTFDLSVVPARKENQTTSIFTTPEREKAVELLAQISEAIGQDKKEFIVNESPA